MKTIEYCILPGVGSGELEHSGTIVDLLYLIPYLLDSMIPSMVVLNQILKIGEFDCGMSGGVRWKPIELTPSDFDGIVEELKGRGLMETQPPDWVLTFDDWFIWKLEVEKSVPSAEHRKLARICREAEKNLNEAFETGDKELVDRLHLKAFESNELLASFIMKHWRE